jgi:hypothetical protein
VEKEIITYTGVNSDTLTGLTRGASGSTAASHASGKSVNTTVVEISGTEEGSEPVWYPQEHDVEVDSDDNGKVYIYGTQLLSQIGSENYLLAKKDVPSRTRITYLHGFDFIPTDITKLTLLIAKKSLMQDAIARAFADGKNDFKPDLSLVNDQEIETIVSLYRQAPMGNT